MVLKFTENDDSCEVKKILLQKYYNILNNVTQLCYSKIY